MANSYPIQALKAVITSDAFLAYAAVYLPEATTQTFVSSAPVVVSSGLVTEAANPVTSCAAIALTAGKNLAVAGALGGNMLTTFTKVLPAYPGLRLYGNMTNGAGSYTLAATDIGRKTVRLAKQSILPPSNTAVWVFDTTGGSAAITIWDAHSDYPFPGSTNDGAVVGDTTPRVTGELLTSITAWNS